MLGGLLIRLLLPDLRAFIASPVVVKSNSAAYVFIYACVALWQTGIAIYFILTTKA